MTRRGLAAALVVLTGVSAQEVRGEGCTTQSQMQPAERDALAGAAREVAGRIEGSDTAGLQASTVAEFAKDFAAIRTLAAETAQHLRGRTIAVEQVYLLDGTQLKAEATEPAQFFCTLHGAAGSVDFTISGLTPGRYGFAIVTARGAGVPSWRVPMLLRQDSGRWLLAGFYPRAAEAAGHDGLWYWREARRLAGAKEMWNAWLLYEQADALLRPANFVETTHLGKLEDEQRAATPPQLANGISAEVPLVLRGVDGGEFRITSLQPDGSLGKPMLEVAVRVDAAGSTDAATWRVRAEAAAKALVAAYPELKKQFGGVTVALESGGRVVFTEERPIA